MAVDTELLAQVNEAIAALPDSAKADEAKNAEAGTQAVDRAGDSEASSTVSGEKAGNTAELKESEKKTDETKVQEKSSDIDVKVEKADTSTIKDEIKPVISDYALTQAVLAGLTIDEARELGSDTLILKVVEKVKALTPEKTVAPEVDEDDELLDLPVLDEEEFDNPEVAKAFNTLTEILKKQHEKIKLLNEFKLQESAIQQEARYKSMESAFDSFINSLGKDFEEALGTGPCGSLKPGSLQLEKRDAIAERAAILVAGYKATGKEPPPLNEVLAESAKIVLADVYQRIKEAKIAEGLAKRETQHINRVDGKKLKNILDPLDEVAAMADDFLAKKRAL